MQTYYVAWMNEYGDEWEDEKYKVFSEEDKCDKFIEEYKRSIVNVHGVKDFDCRKSPYTDAELRELLTVAEYCKLHPELAEHINKLYGKSEE